MNEDSRAKVANPDRTGHFDKVRQQAQAERSQRLGKESGVRPAVNVSRPTTR